MDRENTRKRAECEHDKEQETMEMKKQKKEQVFKERELNNKIITAMKEKNAELTYKYFMEYVNVAREVKADLFSLLFCSLSKLEDESILTKWLSYANEKRIALPENAYSTIIKYYVMVNKEDIALRYLEMILQRGLKIRYRSYMPLLQSISDRGDMKSMKMIIDHMLMNGIQIDENAYYFILQTRIHSKDENGFVQSVTNMMRHVQVIQSEKTLEALRCFVEKYPHWCFDECGICGDGTCDVCGEKMKRIDVSEGEKKRLAEEMEHLIRTRSKEQETDLIDNFTAFKAFLDANGPYDIILDGANIAHYKQNYEGGSFDYMQIQMIVEYLIEKGYKLLIILHEHHFDQEVTTLPEEWLEKKLVYKVIKGNNDDWYWMYASLASPINTFILSNDQMRDHFFQIDNDACFQQWRENNQVYYDIWTDCEKKKFILSFPKPYTKRIQKCEKGFHFPYGTIEENMKMITKNYCLLNTRLVKRHGNAMTKCCVQ